MKTHGIFVDNNGVKISKSSTDEIENLINPIDFIEGTIKSDGSRKYGYGIDVMRTWCAHKDTDKSMFIFRD